MQSRIWELLRGWGERRNERNERNERYAVTTSYDMLRYVTIGDPRESAELFLVGSRQNSTTNDNDDGSDDWDGRECGQK